MKRIDNSGSSSARRLLSFWLLALICASFALAMTSCATGSKATRDAAAKVNAPPPPPPPNLQANQRTPCPALPVPISDAMPDLLENHDQVTELYHDCSDRGDSLVRSMDEWRATAWRWYCKAVVASGLRVTDCPAPAEVK